MFEITSAHLKVFSAVFSNLVVVWLATALTTSDQEVLTQSIFLAIVSWNAALRAEKKLEII
ncbi:hypothetical protein A3F00_02145 [Candidatus Daviesbacteria bacterium RIFCSPHIGHO2_12_FULL_37_11]|uniref:Uncharacterized protein n=1 Tax=Candidatus Daviesbacteria bacterium RIFCSPHIGHO2_12_FULL_37_11 TaxID=1797777 RepID=A0A1F5KAX3_9BACT|nr:MAG: hypothetical protein A2769_00315 [Candidatus Daviesbacteria bacterium RIFCSPHIGHO2_01_FULL_37_27]OGE37980.1 MAG: hypothetical protein A3F00_02145 [Candidatus Daviesbacteria bacterium RIFCSPHIGHO2_12_FULL_37_11]OGE46189.1 MAG: hypothetical protein A3B39_00340 [Candidatus Daviesbacteria bacterium RIFCSPLOWO2_01_FULL_37_10]